MASPGALAGSAPFEYTRSGGYLFTLLSRAIHRGDSPGARSCPWHSQITFGAGIGSLARRRGTRVSGLARGGGRMNPHQRQPLHPPHNQLSSEEWEALI